MAKKPKNREQIIAGIRRTKEGIEQMFIDAAAWHSFNPHEQPIDVDPGGILRRWVEAADQLLTDEDLRPIPKLPDIRSARLKAVGE